jgi:hypothetical protein
MRAFCSDGKTTFSHRRKTVLFFESKKQDIHTFDVVPKDTLGLGTTIPAINIIDLLY